MSSILEAIPARSKNKRGEIKKKRLTRINPVYQAAIKAKSYLNL